MRNIEKIFDKPFVNNNAYKVPEGYFDTLNSRIMQSVINEELTTSKHKKQKKNIFMMPHFRYAVAACMTGLIASIATILYNKYDTSTDTASLTATGKTETVQEEYTTECMEYAMIDDNDIYQYLADQ